MRNKKKWVLSFAVCFLFVAFMVAPYRTQYAQYGMIDPDGESSVAYTLQNTSGDPPGITSGAYLLDDGSIVINLSGSQSVDQSATYSYSVDPDNNTYSISQDASGAIPICWATSVAVYTVRISDGSPQVKTTNQLNYRVLNGTVGATHWADLYEVLPPGVTGGLTWTIQKSPVDTPYNNSNLTVLTNDTGNGKYKNFNFGDPNLSTVAVHFARIEKRSSDPEHIFRLFTSHKMKNEGKRAFKGVTVVNGDLASCAP